MTFQIAQAFVATDCPFYENDETRDEMFTATSFYGDSELVRNNPIQEHYDISGIYVPAEKM